MRHDSGIPKKTKSLYQGKKKNAFRCFTSKNSNSQFIISRSTSTLVRARSQSSAYLSLPLTHACSRDLGIVIKNARRCSQDALGKKRSMTTFWLPMPVIFRMVAAGNFNIHECYKRPEARTVHKAAALSTYTKIEVKLTSKTLFSVAPKMQVMC